MYKEALDLQPENPDALLNYYHAKQQVIDWEDREVLFRRIEQVTERQLSQRHLTTVGAYYSLLSPFDQEQMLGIAESHASRAYERVAWMLPHMPPAFGAELEPPLHRLRVGYIMADFRHHVTAHLLQASLLTFTSQRQTSFPYKGSEPYRGRRGSEPEQAIAPAHGGRRRSQAGSGVSALRWPCIERRPHTVVYWCKQRL